MKVVSYDSKRGIERRWGSVALADTAAGRANCTAPIYNDPHAQVQRYALSDKRDSGLHPLGRRLSAELPAP